MRPEPNRLVDKYRCVHSSLGPSPLGANYGYFEVEYCSGDPTWQTTERELIVPSGLHLRDHNSREAKYVKLIEYLRIISSGDASDPSARGWEHVSISCPGAVPSWSAMSFVKNLFWSDEETVVQFHPKKSAYINVHTHCLHLWKLANHDCLLPPKELIG